MSFIMNTGLDTSLPEVKREFSIKHSAHAIHVLSTSLYSRPIEAIIRELAANALDSHKAAGTTEKFKVIIDGTPVYSNYAPSTSYRFLVRDYGTGLAPADLEKLYTTYFDSTKTPEDGAIGSFGLGSKSPFAYTKQFFIDSYWYGSKLSYTAFIDKETGIPVLERVGQPVPTEETNGLCIYFGINNKDHYEFISVASKVLRHFHDVAALYTSHNYSYETKQLEPQLSEIELPNITLNFPDFYIENNRDKPITVLLNRIEYRLDTNHLNVSPVLRKLPLVLRMPTGSVDVTPSREEIHYNQKTLNSLTAALDDAEKVVNKKVDEILSSYTLFELRQKQREIISQYWPILSEPLIVNGLTISSQVSLSNKVWSFDVKSKWRKGTYVNEDRFDRVKTFNCDKVNDYLFVIADKTRKNTDTFSLVNPLTKQEMRRLLDHTVNVCSKKEALLFNDETHWLEFVTEVGLPSTYTIINFSDIPVIKQVKNKSVINKDLFFTYRSCAGGSTSASSYWNPLTEAPSDDDNVLLVPLMHYSPFYKESGKYSPNSIKDLIDLFDPAITLIGYRSGVSEKQLEKLNFEWQDAFEYLEEKIKAFYAQIEGSVFLKSDVSLTLKKFLTHPKFEDIESFRTVRNIINDTKDGTLLGKIRYSSFGKIIQLPQFSELYENELVAGIVEQFPMLEYYIETIHYSNHKEVDPKVIDYIVETYIRNG